MTKMSTVSGIELDPLDPHPNDIDIFDIATALARQCRFNGHVGHYLSVARHCIWVSEQLDAHGPTVALWGLLHDASEAYVGDVITPIKHLPKMSSFRDIEDAILLAIAKRFDLPYPMPTVVNEADKYVTHELEMTYGFRWTHDTTYAQDEDAFLARFDELVAAIDTTPIKKTGVQLRHPPIIGLSGYAGAGKDVVGKALVGLGYERRAFADPMRAALYALNPMVGNNMEALQDVVDDHGWDKAKRLYGEIRELLQRLGTEVGRGQFGEDFWVELAMRDFPARGVVFTDVRFPNEYDAITDAGGEMWRIEREGVGPTNTHMSETALDERGFDLTFHNDMPLDEVSDYVVNALAVATSSLQKVFYGSAADLSPRLLKRVDL